MIILLLVFLAVAGTEEEQIHLLIIFPIAERTQPHSSVIKLDFPPPAVIYLFFQNIHQKKCMPSQML